MAFGAPFMRPLLRAIAPAKARVAIEARCAAWMFGRYPIHHPHRADLRAADFDIVQFVRSDTRSVDSLHEPNRVIGADNALLSFSVTHRST